jgi:hypothetical protein
MDNNNNNNNNNNRMSWLEWDAEPQTIWEELAVRIWNDHFQKSKSNDKLVFAGYEYWCNIITPEAQLDWHVDKDEDVWEQYTNADADADATQKEDADLQEGLKTPYMGAVYYGYPHVFTGGHLELFPHHPRNVPDPRIYSHEYRERVQAEYNRLVFLNVSEWHRVSPVLTGARYTLAVNVWKERPLEIQQRRGVP